MLPIDTHALNANHKDDLMKLVRAFSSGLLMSLLVIFAGSAHAKLSLNDKVLLQSVMQQHIEKSLVNGAFLHLDAASGSVRPLHQEAAHPIILRMGKYFVLCADFRDDSGDVVNVDFYLAPQSRSYVVFQSVVEDRKLLERLMNNGDVVRVD